MRKIIAVILILLALTTPAQAAPAAGVARVVAADCRESVLIWQDAPATGLQGGAAFVTFLASPHDVPFVVRYIYSGTLRNGNAVYRPEAWLGPVLSGRTIEVTGGEIYDGGGRLVGWPASGDVFSVACVRAFVPVVVR